MTTSHYTIAVAAILLLTLGFVVGSRDLSLSGAPSGLASTVATTSNPTVNTTAATVFATSTGCASRVITTVASPVMITFSDYAGQTPTALFGHLQAASTTVTYDAGLFGCGLVKIYSFVSSNITVTETR